MKTVLIVEDRFFIRKRLETDLIEEGYFTMSYENSEEASREICEGLKYSIAVIDLSLPQKIDGIQLIKESKRINPEIPVIACSSYGYKPTEANAYWQKEESNEGLLTLIRKILQ